MDALRDGSGGTRSGAGWEVLLLVAFVAACYFLRAGDLTLRGEESRWAQVGREMARSGDWAVPRQQGEPFLSRPPLHSWAIAGLAGLRGEFDVWAVRLPSLLATLATTLLVWAYARQFLPRFGAFASALAYASTGGILQNGRGGETEPLFILLVSTSLFLWHWGYTRRWHPGWTWAAGYGCAALGMLCKGPQGAAYFVGPVLVYLLLRRDWRFLFGRWHLAGIGLFALAVGVWLLPFAARAGWPAVAQIFTGDTAMRFLDAHPGTVLTHLAVFPLELFGTALPWSLFLLAYLSRSFRARLGDARPMTVFLGICLAVTFPTVWLPPGSVSRYFLPLFPCLALLTGIVLQRLAEPTAVEPLRRLWRYALTGMGGFMAVMALALAGIAWLVGDPHLAPWRQPAGVVVAYTLAVVGLLLLSRRARQAGDVWRVGQGVVAVALFMGLNSAWIGVNSQLARSEDAGPAVARVKEELPDGVRLFSFNPTHHLFSYYYRDPIAQRPWPRTAAEVGPDVEYFCYQCYGHLRLPLPFAWEEIAAVSMDRNRHDSPEMIVVVGRRLDAPACEQGRGSYARPR